MTARAAASSGAEDYDQIVAAKLRGVLAEKRISKHQLAQRIGQTDFWVGRRANGQTPITVGELLAIAEALGEPVERFLPGGGSSRLVSAFGSEG
jgi:transcriptional regulator with XRE-family HTH domain